MFQNSDSEDFPSFTTPWTLIHLLNGMLFGFFTKPLGFQESFSWGILMHTLYEVKDIWNEEGGNSFLNSVGDQIFAIIGFFIGFYTKSYLEIAFLSVVIFGIFSLPQFKSDQSSNILFLNRG